MCSSAAARHSSARTTSATSSRRRSASGSAGPTCSSTSSPRTPFTRRRASAGRARSAQVDRRRGGGREQHGGVADGARDEDEDRRDHADRDGGGPGDLTECHAGIVTAVPDPALTPDLALDYLGELSTDIRAGVVIDSQGDLVAVTGDDRDRGEKMRTLALELLDAAGDGFDQAEVVTLEGSVFVVRGEGWTVAVVAGRQPLASLMFHDLRNVVRELG